jgi:segregation and condensation protein B
MSDIQEVRESMFGESGPVAAVYPLRGTEEGDFDLDPVPAPQKRGNGKRPQARPQLQPQTEVPLRRVLEAVLFATDRPVKVEEFLFAVPDRAAEEIERELLEMEEAYRDLQTGFHLQRTGGGYQLQTDPELHEYVHRFLIGKKRGRLSRAAMETLAIIAYRQPMTRGEAEDIRGVDCGHVFHTLLERNLIAIRGRSQALGRPLLYATTEEFLHYFGINSLADLPSLEELRSLLGDDPLEDPEIRRALEEEGMMPEASAASESEEAPLLDPPQAEQTSSEAQASDPREREFPAAGQEDALPAAS